MAIHSTLLRLPKGLHDRVRELAACTGRTINHELELATRLHVARAVAAFAQEAPAGTPGAEAAQEAAQEDIEQLSRVAYQRAGDSLLVSYGGGSPTMN